jgi:hypothetical protein
VSEVAGTEFAGGTTVVDDVVDEADEVEADKVEVVVLFAKLSGVEGAV